MWLFTTVGFFSVVQKPNDRYLTVRARVAEDLEKLREKYMPELSAVILGGGKDYPFRATIDHENFGRGLSQIAEDISYDNFRDEIARVMGNQREQVYSQVWKVLMRLEHEPHDNPSNGDGQTRIWKRLSYGGIVVNKQDKVLLKEPKDHFGGYVWTFPTGSCHAGEIPEKAVMREVEEETGIMGRIIQRLPGTFETETTLNSYFLMAFEKETDWQDIDTLRVRWANEEEAEKLIGMTTVPAFRDHDLEVLRMAYRFYNESIQAY